MLTLARQHPQLRNRDHLDRIYDGLRCEYKHYVRRGDFSSLDDLISMTDDFETLKREERPQATHTITPKKYDRREVCWRCKRSGHHRHSCKNERILFCSYCGREGTFSYSCRCRNAVVKRPITRDTRYHILVLISGLEIRALIDTGASRTHINERVANHLITCGIRHTQSREVAQMADESLATLSRMFNVSISFGRKKVPMCVSEIPTLAEDVILGMDFLTACGVEIRLGGMTLRTSSTDQASPLHSLTSREFLTPEENERFQTLLENHRTRFDGCNGRCTVAKCEIRPKYNRPIKQRYSLRNPAMMERKATRPAKPSKYIKSKSSSFTPSSGAEKPAPYRPPLEARPRIVQDIQIVPAAVPSVPPPLAYTRGTPRKVTFSAGSSSNPTTPSVKIGPTPTPATTSKASMAAFISPTESAPPQPQASATPVPVVRSVPQPAPSKPDTTIPGATSGKTIMEKPC